MDELQKIRDRLHIDAVGSTDVHFVLRRYAVSRIDVRVALHNHAISSTTFVLYYTNMP